MAQEATTSVLERKLAAGRDAEANGGRSVLRALRLSLARSAAELFDLPLAVIGAKQAWCDHEGAAAFLSDDRLLVVLDGANGLAGAVSMDGACVAALIQQQTMGRITGIEMAKRAFTGTDAALAEPLIESVLAKAVDLVEVPGDVQCLSGFRFGARAEDVRSLMLTLEAEKFRVFDLTVDIAEGAFQGAICLLMPVGPMDEAAESGSGAQVVPSGPHLDQAFGVMRAELTAMICRIRIPLAELAAMRPDDVIPLMRERLDQTELVTINGQQVASGRLGQINGLRALRLNETRAQPSTADPQGDDIFAEHNMQDGPDASVALLGENLAGPVVVDSTVVTGVPAPIDTSGAGSDAADNNVTEDDELGNILSKMTPEEAAVEISQLAGLKSGDSGN